VVVVLVVLVVVVTSRVAEFSKTEAEVDFDKTFNV
jgi:hypothetical protein